MGSCCACDAMKIISKEGCGIYFNENEDISEPYYGKKGIKKNSRNKENESSPKRIEEEVNNINNEEKRKSISPSNSTKDAKDFCIILNSKIPKELIEKLNSEYEALNDGIQVEEVQLGKRDGVEYRGEWNPIQKEMHGRGILLNSNSVYLGYFKNNKKNGRGKKLLLTNEISVNDIFTKDIKPYYIGEWKDDYQEGEGEEFWPDEAYYKGQYHEGMKWGKGYLSFPGHFIYNGDFKEDEINGEGTIEYIDGRNYKGEWQNNKMHGSGTFTWKDGRVYKGHYVNNLKEGIGEFEWPNGKKYKGSWVQGKQNDDGEIYDPDKKQWIHGKWKMGIKVKSNVS